MGFSSIPSVPIHGGSTSYKNMLSKSHTLYRLDSRIASAMSRKTPNTRIWKDSWMSAVDGSGSSSQILAVTEVAV